MKDETALDNVASSDFLQTVDNVIMFGVTVWGQEVLYNLDQEKDLWKLEEILDILITLIAKSHYEKVEQHIWYNDHTDDQLEESNKWTILIQDITNANRKV